MAQKVRIYGDLIIKFDDNMYIVWGNKWSHNFIGQNQMGVQKSEPRWGCKSAVLCGEAAQGLMLLFERGLLQYLVKLALRVIPAPLKLFLLGLCHLKHDLIINCKLK